MKRLETEIRSDYQGEEKQRRDQAISKYISGKPLAPADKVILATNNGQVVSPVAWGVAQDHTWDTVSPAVPQPEKPPATRKSLLSTLSKIISIR